MESAAIGAMAGARVLVACSGIWACAHEVRIVRVDVAVGELHVGFIDEESAALPE
jgi:hypothetical protein